MDVNERKTNFINKSILKFKGKYDYSKVEYVNNQTKVTIICPIHGEFSQTPHFHLKSKGCTKCSGNYRLTNDEFINICHNVHNNKYDYSLTKYIKSRNKVTIICPIHGEFSQVAGEHKNGANCPKCSLKTRSLKKRLTNDEFISRSNELHNYKYDYSKVKYIDGKTKIIVICPIHGEFEQRAINHLRGYGCKECYNHKRQNPTNGYNNFLGSNQFIEKSNKIHNNTYDYSKIKYINSKSKVDIICKKHGIFKMIPNAHLNGQGCPECGNISKRLTNIEFIEKSNKIHNNNYDYSKVKYINSETKVIIICPIHGEFYQPPHSHLKGYGCPRCNSSKGELRISEILDKLKIKYETQKKFEECKYKTYLKFDFYLPKYNICIEYDGAQHFRSVEYFGGDHRFEKQKMYDEIKNKYCKDNKIRLIRIPYFKYSEIENIIYTI